MRDPSKLRFAFGIGILTIMMAGATLGLLGGKPRVISAYGVAICGIPHHVVLVYRDGAQRVLKGLEILDDEDMRQAEKLPADKSRVFNVCPKAPPLKVY